MVRTLEFYGFHETNDFVPALKPCNYKVKVSDREKNIITIEDDGALLAMVGLKLEGGVLSLTDAARGDTELASVEFPSADKIKSLEYKDGLIVLTYSDAYTKEEEQLQIDVTSLVDIYEAGAGLQLDESEDGKKTFSIRLSESNDEDALKIDEKGGLKFDGDKFTTDKELEDALNDIKDSIGKKADIEYVDEKFNSLSGISDTLSGRVDTLSDDLAHVKRVIGTDEEIPSLNDRINTNKDAIGAVSQEVQNISGSVAAISADVVTLSGVVDDHEDAIDGINVLLNGIVESVDTNTSNIEELSGKVATQRDDIDALQASVRDLDATKADRTELSGMQTTLQTAIDAVEDALVEEVARAKGAEENLNTLIAAEKTDRQAVEGQLWTAIGNEATERSNSDTA